MDDDLKDKIAGIFGGFFFMIIAGPGAMFVLKECGFSMWLARSVGIAVFLVGLGFVVMTVVMMVRNFKEAKRWDAEQEQMRRERTPHAT